ncbi:uncharacterized protein LOC110703132 [Chenopodium quinoa]|uniref:uncharacterized protein LOC110703132 n=1 Tax=Chenopodium quinoa TaxID=63459 RepID=UPI000B76F9A6|nr:uncharacterized protein LOC110703132 [Chenopodium quinoa]
MILECPAASSIWRHSVLRLDTRQVDMGSFRGWCCLMQDKYKDSKWWDVFWSIAWGIWRKRNMWIFEKKERRESDILHKAMGLIGEYEEANLRENSVSQGLQCSSVWKAPAAGLYKLNTDAAFHGQILGIGGVLRDDSGAAVVAYCSTKKGSFAVDVGEAVAMRASFRIAMEAGFSKFILETDNLKLYHHMKKGLTPPCAFGNVVRDILLLSRGCQCISFSFVRRTGNVVAHCLANMSFKFSEYRVWLEDTPVEIQGAICNDTALLIV